MTRRLPGMCTLGGSLVVSQRRAKRSSTICCSAMKRQDTSDTQFEATGVVRTDNDGKKQLGLYILYPKGECSNVREDISSHVSRG